MAQPPDTKKRLLLISHAFHQKTKSNDFLLDLLAPAYSIETCYLDPYDPRGQESLGPFLDRAFDLVICLQLVPPARLLKRLACPLKVFFPMYDESGGWGLERWFRLRHMRIISFSSHLADDLERWGFDVRRIQYFPPPADSAEEGDDQKAFFWSRTEKINLGTVATLLQASSVSHIHVHKSMDPGQAFAPATPEIAGRYHLTESEWFPTRAELGDRLQACAIYLAPRLREGIGMSFLEAMAMGRCVIAPDQPTMNEYITHGVTGLLYDPARVAPLRLPDIRAIQDRTRAYMREGHGRWEREKGRILDWCKEAPRDPGWRPWIHLAVHIVLHPLEASRPWRRNVLSVRLRRGSWRIRIFGWDCLGSPGRRR